MGINVSGSNVKLWKNERQGKNGNHWFDYSVGISKKAKDGNYVNSYVRVKFSSKLGIPEDIPNGAQMDFEGFLTPDVYPDRNGQEVKRDMIVITEAKFHDLYQNDDGYSGESYEGVDSFASAADDIPF